MEKEPEYYVRGVRFAVDSAVEAITAVFADASARNSKCIILYIHGRALPLKPSVFFRADSEPEKSQKEILPELESRYGAAVLMLHWPHRGIPGVGFPENDARDAAYSLDIAVKNLSTNQVQRNNNLPIVLLTHSMGSFLLEERITSNGMQGLEIFDSFVICSPACDSNASKIWLEKLPNSKTFVTINKRDPVLRGRMLGNQSAEELKHKGLAPNVLYLDTSSEDVGHRYFVYGKTVSEGEALLYKYFFKAVLSGQTPDSQWLKQVFSGYPIYRIKS